MKYNTIHPMLDTCGPISQTVGPFVTEAEYGIVRSTDESKKYAQALAKAMESLSNPDIYQNQTELHGSLDSFHRHVGGLALSEQPAAFDSATHHAGNEASQPINQRRTMAATNLGALGVSGEMVVKAVQPDEAVQRQFADHAGQAVADSASYEALDTADEALAYLPLHDNSELVSA